MKKLIVASVVAMSLCHAGAITLNVGHPKNKTNMAHNTGVATLVSSELGKEQCYEILLHRTKSDKGEYVLFAMTCVLLSDSKGGMKTKRKLEWIPESFKKVELPTNQVGKVTYQYFTPYAKFEKEKWRYLGNWSSGAKVNGIFVGIADVSNGKKKIVRTFQGCTGAIPKSMDEVEQIASNKTLQRSLDDLGCINCENCRLEMVEK